MATVGVMVVIFDSGEYVGKAIDSVRDQTFTDLEVLLLDDNSTDPQTAAEISRALQDSRFQHVRFETTEADRRAMVTYAANINYGVEQTATEFVTFLAGDDYYHPDRIERMVDKAREGHDVVYGSQERPNADGRFVPEPATEVLADAFNRVDMSSVLQTRASFMAVGGFPIDPSMWGDADAHYWKRLTDAGYVFVPVDDPERPTDAKFYRDDSTQARWGRGEWPWSGEPR